MKKIFDEKPLFQQYEKKYVEEVEMDGLQKRKAELSKIRNFYQPINKDEMKEHSLNYSSVKREK